MDILTLLLQYINLPAAFVGVVAVLTVKYFLPTPVPAGTTPPPTRSFQTVAGSLGTRLLPLVGPVSATVACIAIEWFVPHAELAGKTGIVPNDVVRGILSGWASDFFLRVYYKSIAGV